MHEDVFHLKFPVADSGDFGNAGDEPFAGMQAGHMNHDVHGIGDVPAGRAGRQFGSGQSDHEFQTVECFPGVVGMHGTHGTIVTGVHGLQHIEDFGSPGFSHDDPVGPHAERISKQIALRDGSPPFHIRHAGFQRNHVGLLKLQFGGFFDGDHALRIRDESADAVQQSGFSGARSAADDQIHASADGQDEKIGHRRSERSGGDQIFDFQSPVAEPADGNGRAAERQRRNDGIEPRSVGQPGVHDGTGFVDAPAGPGNQTVNELHQMGFIGEPHVGGFESAAAFHQNAIRSVDQNIGDVRIIHQRFQRAEPIDFIHDLTDHGFPLTAVQTRFVALAEVFCQAAQLAAQFVFGQRFRPGKIDHIDHLPVEAGFESLEVLRTAYGCG